MAEMEGFGSTLSYTTALDYSGSPVALGKCIELQFPELQVGNISTKHLTTTSQTETNQAGWKKPGKGKFTLLWDHTVYGTLNTKVGTMMGWIATYADGSTESINGYISKKGTKIEIEGLTLMEYEFQGSGPITYVAGS